MTRVSVDLAALGDLVERLAQFQDHLARVHDDADRRIGALAAGGTAGWTGEAAEAQRAAHRRWSAAAAELQDALAALRAAGSTAHANYGAAVAANRRMWRA